MKYFAYILISTKLWLIKKIKNERINKSWLHSNDHVSSKRHHLTTWSTCYVAPFYSLPHLPVIDSAKDRCGSCDVTHWFVKSWSEDESWAFSPSQSWCFEAIYDSGGSEGSFLYALQCFCDHMYRPLVVAKKNPGYRYFCTDHFQTQR